MPISLQQFNHTYFNNLFNNLIIYLEFYHLMQNIQLYYLLTSLIFHTTNAQEHQIYYFQLRSYVQNIIYLYIMLLKIYYDTIIFVVLFHFQLNIMLQYNHNYFEYQDHATIILVFFSFYQQVSQQLFHHYYSINHVYDTTTMEFQYYYMQDTLQQCFHNYLIWMDRDTNNYRKY